MRGVLVNDEVGPETLALNGRPEPCVPTLTNTTGPRTVPPIIPCVCVRKTHRTPLRMETQGIDAKRRGRVRHFGASRSLCGLLHSRSRLIFLDIDSSQS